MIRIIHEKICILLVLQWLHYKNTCLIRISQRYIYWTLIILKVTQVLSTSIQCNPRYFTYGFLCHPQLTFENKPCCNPQALVNHKFSPGLKGYKSVIHKYYNTVPVAFGNSVFFLQTFGKNFFVTHKLSLDIYIWIKHTLNVTKWGSIFDHDQIFHILF